MIIAYGEANKATWALDAQGDFRTLVITDNDKKKEELKFKLDEYSIYLFCKDGKPYEIGSRMLYRILSEILTVIADTDNVEDAINEIMIALL